MQLRNTRAIRLPRRIRPPAPPVLGARTGDRANNFNLLRALAAIGVLVSHAWPLSLGVGATEPLFDTLGVTLGSLCVYVFFAISGFFITRSFVETPDWRRFLAARALRLFPALLVVLVATVLVAGLFLTTDPDRLWREAPVYILRNLTLFRLQHELPGVFLNTPYGPVINGSLWTLVYEAVCYAGVFLAGLLGLLRRPRLFAVGLVVTAAACLVVPLFEGAHPRLQAASGLVLPFAIGAGFYVWRDRLPLSPLAALAMWGVVALLPASGPVYSATFALALAYTVFVLGYWHWQPLLAFNRLGDYSYGIYIYAFPIQQLVAEAGIRDPATNIMLALPPVLLCAVASWHLVERWALSLKPAPLRH